MDSEAQAKPAPPSPSTPPAPGPRRRLWPRLLAGLLLVLLTIVALLAWALATESGARFVLARVQQAMSPTLVMEGVHGRLLGPLEIERLRHSDKGQEIILSGLRLQWQPRALLSRHVHLKSLEIERLEIVSAVQSDTPPPTLPDSLALPVTIALDRLHIKRTELKRGPLPLAELGTLALALDYDGQRYRLRLDPLALSASSQELPLLGRVQGEASLADRPPYALRGALGLSSQTRLGEQDLSASGRATLAGSLAELDLGLNLELAQKEQPARLEGMLKLMPFAERMLGESRLSASRLDLSLFHAAAPSTRIELRLAADQEGRGTVQLSNAAAGPWSEQKLPLSSLRLNFAQEARRFLLRDIDLRLGSAGRQAGRIHGQAELAGGDLQLALQLAAVDLAGLDARARRTALSGRVDLRHAEGEDRLQMDIKENGALPIALQARATLAQSALRVEDARIQAGGGQLRASGQAQLDGEQALQAQGSFERFSPRAFGRFPGLPDLLLNGHFTLKGKRAPQLAGQLQFDLANSLLAGQPLQGQGRLNLAGEVLDVPQFKLQAGDNTVALSGRLSPARESGSLRYDFKLARLEQLGLGWRGALQGQGNLKGQARAPLVDGEFQAQALEAPGLFKLQSAKATLQMAIDAKAPMALKSVQLDAQVQQLSGAANASGKAAPVIASTSLALLYGGPRADAPLQIRFLARDMRDGERGLDQFSLNADGSTGKHVLELLAERDAQKLTASAAGGLAFKAGQPEWRGQLSALQSQGQVAARLLGPARVAASAKRQSVEDLRLDTTGGTIELNSFLNEAGHTASRGRIVQLQPGRLLEMFVQSPPVASDLVLDGEWDLDLAQTLSGQASLRRSSGDLTVKGASPVALGLSRLQATLKAQGSRLELDFEAAGRQLGQIGLNASAGFAMQGRALHIAGNTPLTGSAHADIPAIDWVAGLVSPALITNGRLQSELRLGGTLDNPRLAGRVSGDNLRVFLTDLGLDLRQGQLAGSFTEDRFLLQTLRFASSEGDVSISGPIRLAGAKPSGELSLAARRYALFNPSDRRITVSGDSKINLAAEGVKVRGAFKVDQGFVDIGSTELPQLSDDVVIVGRQKKEGKPLGVDVALTIDLGEQLRLQGRGLKARLAGGLKVENRPGQALSTDGVVRVAEGTFSAYGRELTIEQGILRFTGAINNPALDIRAMRRGQEVAAGVSLRGTVLSPRVSLVSEPTVPDVEKLSWLVLGRGLSNAGGGADAASLQAAAGSLLTGGNAAGAQNQIASHFGLDSVGLSTSSDSLQQRVVTLGKQVSDKLFVSVAQGLETSNPALRLRYTISPKLTAEVEAGASSFLSLFYNIAFD